jgi:hypothetical protein
MQHTAIIGAGLPPVDITFNCSDPTKSVSGTYGPGTYTDPDSCASSFLSATVAGVTIDAGNSAHVQIGPLTAVATVETTDQGRHITVNVELYVGGK